MSNKNPANIQTVDVSRHAKLKVKVNPGFPHAKDRHVVAVNVSELGISSSTFPIVFVENPGDKRLLLMAMLGLKPGENVYYGDQYWESSYIPMAVQRHPFIVGLDDRADTEQLAACLEMDSAALNEKDGVPLFNDDGSESDVLRTSTQMLNRMLDAGRFTEAFIQKLRELDLVLPFEIGLQIQRGETKKITGLYTIDETKMKALSGEQLKDLQDRDYLAPCHLLLVSLYQLNQLIRLRNRKGGEQIVNYRLDFPTQNKAAASA